MGIGYNERPWVPRGVGSDAREAFEERNSRGVLLGGITISSQGYTEGLVGGEGERWEDPVLFPTLESADILAK